MKACFTDAQLRLLLASSLLHLFDVSHSRNRFGEITREGAKGAIDGALKLADAMIEADRKPEEAAA